MKLVESILTKNPCYTAGRKITVKGLMPHSVGCPQPRASVFVNGWNSASYDRACVHGFIDALDGTIYQTLPWNHRGWHAGGAANNTHIGVEMCEPACIKYTGGASFTCSDTATAKACATRTYEAAVELFAMLCQKYNLNPLADGVIISHKEGHTRGVASNHGDPDHLWRQLGMSYSMDTFRKAVKGCTDYKKAAKIIKDGGYATNSTYVEKLCNIIEKYNLTQYDTTVAQPGTGNDSVSGFPGTPFKVRVLIDDLNYRSLPSMDGAVRGQTGKGVFTITGVQDNWGKLKSGAGWIYLGNPSYCTVQGAASAVPEQSTAPEQPTASGLPYKVRVSVSDLNIRKGPGTNYGKTGKFTGKGVFTIVEEADGQGASKWGLLKSYAGKRNGWIALDYANKV